VNRVRCAIYTRKSSEEGLDQAFNSLDAQREACQAYILSQAGEGWQAHAEVYDDGGYSGGSLERPALKRLLADVEQKRVDVVVVYKVDRLTRALSDFARIVEVLDGAGASFVSVTQAFNTTTSMGRLTLNVLLSFAQFEREVTGERIRDKIAASKKKGLWMGGCLPLGYDPDGRTLKVNEPEAEVVGYIFQRYLALGSVHKLEAELKAEGYRSKTWTAASSGRVYGGLPFTRGPLFHILSNRLYLGEIPHKGEHHAGQHPAIIDSELFARVQQALAVNAGPRRRAQAGLAPRLPAAPLTGRIFDDAGHRMSPVSARKGDGPTYRYYVSTSLQKGKPAAAGSLKRAPALALERLVRERGAVLGIGGSGPDEAIWTALRGALDKIIVGRGSVVLAWRRVALALSDIELEQAIARLHMDSVDLTADQLTLKVAVVLSRRGQAKVLIGPKGGPAIEEPTLDRALLKALVQGQAWRKRLTSRKALTIADVARQEGVRPGYCERTIRLSFLAPDLKRAILEGRAPAGLMLERLKKTGLPDDWKHQRAVAIGCR